MLLSLGDHGSLDASAWGDRVRRIDARHDGGWELPVIGSIAPPPAVLIRPDGYVAWAGGAGLADALATWVGPA